MNGINCAGYPRAPRPPKAIEPVKAISPAQISVSNRQKRSGAMPAKDHKRAKQGRNNRQRGNDFEKLLETACEIYLHDKVAKVTRTAEPYRIIGIINAQPIVFKCVKEKKVEPLYKGVLSSGQAIAFEAMTTGQDRIEWDEIKENQRNSLEAYSNMKGFAFVLVSFKLENYYRIPWRVWRDMKSLYGRTYLKPEDIPEYEIPTAMYFGKQAVMFLEDARDFQAFGKGV